MFKLKRRIVNEKKLDEDEETSPLSPAPSASVVPAVESSNSPSHDDQCKPKCVTSKLMTCNYYGTRIILLALLPMLTLLLVTHIVLIILDDTEEIAADSGHIVHTKKHYLYSSSNHSHSYSHSHINNSSSFLLPFHAGSCLNVNSEWQAESNYSIWTMVSDSTSGSPYITSALKLAVSIKKQRQQQQQQQQQQVKNLSKGDPSKYLISKVPEDIDLVMMELSTNLLSSKDWEKLSQVGWKRCTVDRIPPPPVPSSSGKKIYSRYRDQFTKLHLWGMTQYKSILYLDADTLVVGPVHDIFDLKLPKGKKIGAALDYDHPGYFWSTIFNMGVFYTHPRQKEFEHLLSLWNDADKNMKIDLLIAEQNWLNEIYKDAWYDIGYEYNVQDSLYLGNRTFWDENFDSFRVIHFNQRKPWETPWMFLKVKKLDRVCELWRSAPLSLDYLQSKI